MSNLKVTAAELAGILGVSLGTVHRWRRDGEIFQGVEGGFSLDLVLEDLERAKRFADDGINPDWPRLADYIEDLQDEIVRRGGGAMFTEDEVNALRDSEPENGYREQTTEEVVGALFDRISESEKELVWAKSALAKLLRREQREPVFTLDEAAMMHNAIVFYDNAVLRGEID